MQAEDRTPDWDAIYVTASAQQGHFTTAQAAEAGVSPQLLAKHLKSGRIRRVRRAVYRLARFPAGDNEDLVVLWLWSDRKGVLSHETALALQELSDAMPTMVHMTLPRSWSRRRLRVPEGLITHHADVPRDERAWVGCVPVTSPERTILDCAEAAAQPDLIRQALEEALDRGLVARRNLPSLLRRLGVDE